MECCLHLLCRLPRALQQISRGEEIECFLHILSPLPKAQCHKSSDTSLQFLGGGGMLKG